MNNLSFSTDQSILLEPFFELSPDLLCIADYSGYFRRINPAVSKTLGYTMEELYSRPINEFVYPDDQGLTSRFRDQLIKSKPLYNFENRYVCKNGEIVWLSWTSLPVDSDQLIFAIAKDITHKKKLESERNSLLANLTRINQDLKQLTYTTSHDLRTPVNDLLSVFSLMNVSKIDDPETLELIHVLKLASGNLKQTLDKYVDALSHKESLNEQLEEIDLQTTLDRVFHSIGNLIQTSKVSFHIDFSTLPIINFNKVCLESIFLNLISNSIKYARPDRQPVISISSRILNGRSQLIISDNGLGFDMEKVKDKIFGLRQKFHDHLDSKGIGLYLVYNHVTNLGGQITVDSQVNEGACFTITFND
ncbi:PAS domain-containing sensor histidine kinase [Daejeonella oryzae]|uniref:PAS domain-containing sensor histidine kinase n=1 Tax=Daejeonella oryzae TaxID=1122943 RepID=UPI00047A79E4|nr:PAS domain-containing sensor histidine kinase [Daejeonella oryzae]